MQWKYRENSGERERFIITMKVVVVDGHILIYIYQRPLRSTPKQISGTTVWLYLCGCHFVYPRSNVRL